MHADVPVSGHLQIYCDNETTLDLLSYPEHAVEKSKLKHVELHNHWLRDYYKKD